MAVVDAKSYRRDVHARRQRALASAVGVVIEELEARRMMTAVPTLVHIGATHPEAVQGTPFTLRLDAAGNPLREDRQAWDIAWGDGTLDHVQTSDDFVPPTDCCGAPIAYVRGSPDFAQHVYTTPGTYPVQAWLHYRDADGVTEIKAANGLSFDTAYGGGMVRSAFGAAAGDAANAVATLPTGRLLVAGNIGGNFALMKQLSDGTPDPTFGDSGMVTTSFGAAYTARGAAVAVAGGKYLVAGDVHSAASGYDFALARYNADGTLDESFGDHGTVISNFTADARANAVAVQANGDVIVAGFTNGDFAIAHYHADGSPDTAWGTSGKKVLNLGSAGEIAYGIGIAPDGKVVVTGRNTQDVVTVRLNANGTVDQSFGTGGTKVINLGVGDFTYSVAFQSDGKVVLAGETNAHFTVVRLKVNGDLDPAFSGDGIAEIPTLGTAYARTVAVQADGKVVAGGGGGGYYDVVRLKTDGTLDTTFADGGRDQTFDGAPDGGYFSALGAYAVDGRLVAMGGVDTSFLAARYLRQNAVTVVGSGSLANGGFETPPVWTPPNYCSSGGCCSYSGMSGDPQFVTRYAGAALDGWTVESGSVDQIGSLWTPAEGAQSLDLSGATAGVIYQDVQTVPGQDYQLSFQMAGNPAGGSATKSVRITWDAPGATTPATVATDTFTTTGHSTSAMGWASRTHTVRATGTVMRLRFVSLEGSAFGPALDDVRLTPRTLVANGSFNTGTTGWSVEANAVVASPAGSDRAPSLQVGTDDGAGAVHQNLTTVAGQAYCLTFSAAALDPAAGLKVYWGGTLLGSTTDGGAVAGPADATGARWEDFAYTVTAASVLTTLRFEGDGPDGQGTRAYLDDVALVPLVTPAAPSNLRAAAASPIRIDLHWQDNSGDETGFVISSSTDGAHFNVAGRAGAGATDYTVTGLNPNTRYTFRVTAANDGSGFEGAGGAASGDDGVQSGPSNAASATTQVDDVDADHLVAVGVWRINANGRAVAGQSPLPTLEDGATYRLSVTNVEASPGSPPCESTGSAGADPEYALAVQQPNYCCWSGCCNYSAVYGDAEYAWTYDAGLDVNHLPVTDAGDLHNGTDVGVKVTTGLRTPLASWGEYSPAHTYVRDVVANGQGLAAAYADDTLADNVGAVILTIQRVLPSDDATPAPTITGPATVAEGATYSLHLDAGPNGVTAWTIDWGDGNVQTLDAPSQPRTQVVTHVFADGAPNPSIAATATNAGGDADATPLAVSVVPLAPSDLTASSTSDSQVDLAWTNHSHVATAVVVERSDDDGQTWATVGSLDPDAASFQDDNLDEGKAYQYRVHAGTSTARSTDEGPATATTRPISASNLHAVAISSTQIDLDWDDNSDTETSYRVLRSTDGVNYTNYCCSSGIGVDATGCHVTGLTPLTQYYFEVVARGPGGDAIYAAKAQETTDPAGALPAQATGLTAAVTGSNVTLTWDAASDADGFHVERRDGPGGAWGLVGDAGGSDISYVDDTIDLDDHTYVYRLTAFNQYGPAPVSAEATATTHLADPTNVAAVADADGQVVLTWTDNSTNETGFKISRFETVDGDEVESPEADAPAHDGTGQVTLTIGDLTPGTSYTFAVAAATEDLTSTGEALSNPVTPVVRSVSITGPITGRYASDYTLTLHRQGITAALTWEINWGDGTAPVPVTGTPDASGNITATHTYEAPPEGGSAPYTIQATATTATDDEYVAPDLAITVDAGSGLLAASVDVNAAKRAVLDAFEDVRNNVRYEPYFGLKKGWRGTERTGRGNDLDQAELLKHRLEVPEMSQYGLDSVTVVMGIVTLSNDDLANWWGVTGLDSTGAKSRGAIANLLYQAGIPLLSVTPSSITIRHAWVRVTSQQNGWTGANAKDLDPSWKFEDHRASLLPAGDAVNFDEEGFRSQSAQSALEFYESSIAAYLKGQGKTQGATSLADVAFEGAIVAKHFSEFPSLPYENSNGVPFDPELIEPVGHETQVNLTHRVKVTIGGTMTYVLPVWKYGSSPIELVYEAVNGGLRPVLYAQAEGGEREAVEPVAGSSYMVPSGASQVTISVGAVLPDLTVVPTDETKATFEAKFAHDYYRSPGDPLAVLIDGDQIGDASINDVQKELNSFAINDAPLTPTRYGHLNSDYQQDLLALLAMDYVRKDYDARRTIGALTGTISTSWIVGTGLVTGVGSPDAQPADLAARRLAFANPFVFYKRDPATGKVDKGVYVDIKGLEGGFAPVVAPPPTAAGQVAPTNLRVEHAYVVKRYVESELESEVLEQNLNVESVSTAKGFQWAAKAHANFLDLNGNTQANRNAINGMFGNANAYMSIKSELLQQLVDSEIIIPDKLISIGQWDGFVWFTVKHGADFDVVGAAIEQLGKGQTSNGGFATSDDPFATWVDSKAPVSYQVNTAQENPLGDPVNTFNGSLYDDETDFSLPNVAFGSTFARHYDSLNDVDRGFGKGWTFSFGDYLTLDGTTVTWTTAQGQKYDFRKPAKAGKGSNTSYDPPAGLFGTFTSTSKEFIYREKDGTTYHFAPLTGRGGNGRLLSIVDRQGNTALMTYADAQSATPTLQIVFYQPAGAAVGAVPRPLVSIARSKSHVTITDSAKRDWIYHFELRTDGRYLSSVESPFSGKKYYSAPRLTTAYTYYQPGDRRNGLLHTISRYVGSVLRGTQTYDYYANRRAFSTTDATDSTKADTDPTKRHLTEYFSYDLFTSAALNAGAPAYTHAAYYTDPAGHTTKVEYNDAGLMTRTINPDRSRVDQVWVPYVTPSDASLPATGQYHLQSRTNEVGLTDYYRYTSNTGDVEYHLGNSWNFALGSKGRVSGGGIETTYAYDKNFDGVTRTVTGGLDDNGASTQRATSAAYDAKGNLTQSTDAVGGVTMMGYDVNGLMTWSRSPKGNVAGPNDDYKTTFAYDTLGSGQVADVSRLLPGSTGNVLTHVSHTTYDSMGNPVLTTNGVGDTVQTAYDVLARKRATIVDPDHLALKTTYNYSDDLLIDVVDPTLRDTHYTYDEMGRQTSVQDQLTGALTTTDYDDAGRALLTTDPLKRQTLYAYDDRGRLVQTIYADGGFALSQLDGLGRVVGASEPVGNVTTDGLDAVATTSTAYTREGFVGNVIGPNLGTETDPKHQKTTYEYDGLGQQQASHFYTDAEDTTPYRNSLTWRDALGRPVQTRSDDGTVTTTEYDPDGNVTAVTAYDVSGLAAQGRDFMSTKSVKLKNLADALKHTITTDYDIAGRAIGVTDALGYVTRTEYDAANRVVAVIDPRGASRVGHTDANPNDYKTITHYDHAGRVDAVYLPYDTAPPATNPDKITYTYYPDGRTHVVTNARGKQTQYVYTDSAAGLDTKTIDPAGKYTLEHRDLAGEILSVTDRKHNTTDYAYDVRGRQKSVTLPAGESGVRAQTLTTYDSAGNAVTVEDAAAQLLTVNTFDALHRVLSTAQYHKISSTSKVLLTASSQQYVNGDVALTIDARGYRTSYAHDKAGRVTAVYAAASAGKKPTAANQVSSTTYDSFGDVLSESAFTVAGDPTTARTTQHTYDADNRLKSTTDPDPDRPHRGTAPLVTTYEYDAAGNTTKVTDPEGSTVNTYDARNQLKTSQDPSPDGTTPGGTSSYQYDPDGNVSQATDPAGNLTTYHYDDLDRLDTESTRVFLSAVAPDVAVSRTYGYDDNGNRTLETDRLGRHYAFAYDANDRLVDEQWLDSAVGPFTKDLHYRYDAAGRLVWADADYRGSLDAYHDYTLAYDALGRVTRYREWVTNAGASNESALATVDQAYVADVLQTQAGTLAGNANATYTNTYAFDALGHLASVFQAGAGAAGKRVSFGTNPIGDVTSVTRLRNANVGNIGAGTPVANRTYQYDNAGALTAIAYAGAGAATPPEYAIGRDPKHRVATLKLDGGATRSFTYDYDDQLTTAAGQTLAYDPNHNRTSGGTLVGEDNRVKEDAAYKYEYDPEGNLTKRTAKVGGDVTAFAYDDGNELVAVTLHAGNTGGGTQRTVGYDYDAAGRRTNRKVNGSVVETYAYDGTAGPSSSDDILFATTLAAGSNPAKLSRYFYAGGGGTHQVLAEDTPGQVTAAGTITRWYLPDFEGSVRKVVTDTNALIRQIDYDAFGNVTATAGPGPTPAAGGWMPRQQYTGQVADPDTGLSFYGARWYDPTTGRFLNPDPAKEGTNPYAYVGNDPLDMADPTGLSAKLVGLGQSQTPTNIDPLPDRPLPQLYLPSMMRCSICHGSPYDDRFQNLAAFGVTRPVSAEQLFALQTVDPEPSEGMRQFFRALGTVGQIAGGALEVAAFEIPIVGPLLAFNGLDNIQAAIRGAGSDAPTQTVTSQMGQYAAKNWFGASDATALKAGEWTNAGIGLLALRPNVGSEISAMRLLSKGASTPQEVSRLFALNAQIDQRLVASSSLLNGASSSRNGIGGSAAGELVSRNAWVDDLNVVSSKLERLGARAVRLGGRDPNLAERIFQRYSESLDLRLQGANSRFTIEWQPAAKLGSGGERTWSGLVRGQWVSPRGSARLDAGISDLTGQWTVTPREQYYPEVVAGFDITVNPSKPSVVDHYKSAFGEIPIFDIGPAGR